MKKLLALVALAVASQCSAPDLGTDDAIKVCTSFASAYCTAKQSCSPGLFAIDWPDYMTCQAFETNQCVNSYIAPGAGEPAYVTACMSVLMMEPSTTTTTTTWACPDLIDGVNPPPACTVMGALLVGAACAKSSQCTTDWCQFTPGNVCGVCADLPPPGGPCRTAQGIELLCPTGLYCNDQNVCTAFAQEGAACSATQNCEAGYSCVGNVCVAGQTQAGAACGGTTGLGCSDVAGFDCNNQTQSCEPFVLVGPGEPCGYLFNQQSVHCAGGAQCISGTCVGVAGLGQGCDLVGGPFCVSPSRCIVTNDGGTAGTCVITNATSCNSQ